MESQVPQGSRVQLESQGHQVFPELPETRVTWEHKDQKVVKVHKALGVNRDDPDNLENLA